MAWLKQLFVGRPLDTAEVSEQKLSKKAALAVFSSDGLSSTAYATEEILLALAAAGAASFALSIPAAVMIVVLLLLVVTSYSQTLEAYPTGGGAYTVAKENLGVYPALVAGAALLIDYVLTVAVSVAAGVAAITSAVPILFPHRIALGLVFIGAIMWANLRGVRESAAIFAGPVYLFICCAYILGIGALLRYSGGGIHPAAPEPALAGVVEPLSIFLLLRAFASGCTALTGVEAVANGVQAFRPPVSRNAKITQFALGILLGTMFLTITVATRLYGLSPREGETIVSQLGRATFGTGVMYYLIQVATTVILVLAANTAFAGFPRLTSYVASDRFLPRQFANLGDRLVFSNGIIFLGGSAGALVILFAGDVHRLIPLYTVGVFVAFTLSQAGMVIHWKNARSKGYRWRMGLNALGAATTTLVLLIVASVKFVHGAWLVLLAIPAFVWLFLKIRRHYFQVATELSLASYDQLTDLKHTVVVPVPGPNRASLGAIEYARSLSKDVIAVQVNTEGEDGEKLAAQWENWVPDVPLVVLSSPYRSIVRPLLRFIEEMETFRTNDIVTVLLPEFVPARWWQRLLHNQNGLLLRSALSFKPNVVVTSVRRHLRK
ncbi:MAG: APC family permease [Acidobacteria bacterium]|nr:APC family permease [Acidobacteriota bacterium]